MKSASGLRGLYLVPEGRSFTPRLGKHHFAMPAVKRGNIGKAFGVEKLQGLRL